MEVENPLFFETPEDFGQWLKVNYKNKDSQWIGYWKKDSGLKSMTWSESVEQALCYGWIDGLRKTIDSKSYAIRFTKRRKNSTWSGKNIKTIGKLISLGLVVPEAIDQFKNRNKEKDYSYEQRDISLPVEYREQIRKNAKAENYFNSMPPSVLKPSVWWIISAKKEETKLRRLNILIECCERGVKIPMLGGK